jgi:hypothetical protein
VVRLSERRRSTIAQAAGAGEQWLKIIAVNVKDDNDDYRAMMKQMRTVAGHDPRPRLPPPATA